MEMEMPDEIWTDINGNATRTKFKGGEKYHHDRIVAALIAERDSVKRENEELKAKHCVAMRQLDKAKDALRFYAEEHNHIADAIIGVMPDRNGEPIKYIKAFDSPYGLDQGYRARKTLEEIE